MFTDRIGRSAPGVAISGAFINEIFETGFAGWSIEVDRRCTKTIEDFVMTKEAADGTILKKRETDKDTKVSFERHGHYSDDWRYFVTTILPGEFLQYKSRYKRGGSVAGIRA